MIFIFSGLFSNNDISEGKCGDLDVIASSLNICTPGMDKITNIDLREALTMRGVIYTLYADKILLTTNQKYFTLNENNKQKLVEIQNFDVLKSSKFISNCGGSLKVDNTMSY